MPGGPGVTSASLQPAFQVELHEQTIDRWEVERFNVAAVARPDSQPASA
jgi:hypothetical protein